MKQDYICCIDICASTLNGDISPNRLAAIKSNAWRIANMAVDSHPESRVAIVGTSTKNIALIVPLSRSIKNSHKRLFDIKSEGTLDVLKGLIAAGLIANPRKIAQQENRVGALRTYSVNSNHNFSPVAAPLQRKTHVFFFIASPLDVEQHPKLLNPKIFKNIAKQYKDYNITLDFIFCGQESEIEANYQLLKGFIEQLGTSCQVLQVKSEEDVESKIFQTSSLQSIQQMKQQSVENPNPNDEDYELQLALEASRLDMHTPVASQTKLRSVKVTESKQNLQAKSELSKSKLSNLKSLKRTKGGNSQIDSVLKVMSKLKSQFNLKKSIHKLVRQKTVKKVEVAPKIVEQPSVITLRSKSQSSSSESLENNKREASKLSKRTSEIQNLGSSVKILANPDSFKQSSLKIKSEKPRKFMFFPNESSAGSDNKELRKKTRKKQSKVQPKIFGSSRIEPKIKKFNQIDIIEKLFKNLKRKVSLLKIASKTRMRKRFTVRVVTKRSSPSGHNRYSESSSSLLRAVNPTKYSPKLTKREKDEFYFPTKKNLKKNNTPLVVSNLPLTPNPSSPKSIKGSEKKNFFCYTPTNREIQSKVKSANMKAPASRRLSNTLPPESVAKLNSLIDKVIIKRKSQIRMKRAKSRISARTNSRVNKRNKSKARATPSKFSPKNSSKLMPKSKSNDVKKQN